MGWASMPTTSSIPDVPTSPSLAKREGLPRLCRPAPEGACPQATAPSGSGLATGPTARSPVSLPRIMTRHAQVHGTAACWSAAPSSTASSPVSPDGVPKTPPSRPWSGSRGRAGASRKASRPPRTSSASTTTRPGPGRLAPARVAGHARLRGDSRRPPPDKRHDIKKNTVWITMKLIRWSIGEKRPRTLKPAQRRVPITRVPAWSSFRRAHQAAAQKAHLKQRMRL